MNILWIPQISSLGSDGKVYLSKDSNMSALYNILDSNFGKNNTIIVYFEFNLKVNVIIDSIVFDKIEKLGGSIIYNENREYTNAKLERFNVDLSDYMRVKNNLDRIDVVFVNEPTKVEALRSIFTESKIVTYNHWLACKNMKDIELRQYEGMCNADICFVNSIYAKNQIEEYYKDMERKPNIKVSNPTFIENVLDVKPVSLNDKPNIIYNHRLSNDEYYNNAFKTLKRIMKKFYTETGIKATIYFTNPTNKNVDLYSSYFDSKEINLISKKDYFDFLSSNNVNIHLNTFFDSEGMWCQSTVDAAIKGNICLLPYKFGYAEMFDNNYYGYCNDENEMVEKLKNLFTNSTSICYNYNDLENKSSKIIGNELNDILEDLVYGNC